MIIERLGNLTSALSRLAGERPNRAVVAVYFQTNYAIHVHEDLQAFHPTGQAKYLEAPARKYARRLADEVRKAVASGTPVVDALVLAGLTLQRFAQLLVPVDTGVLRNSARTVVERAK